MKTKRLYWYSGIMILVLYVLCLSYRIGFDDQAYYAGQASGEFANFAQLTRTLKHVFVNNISNHPLFSAGLVFLSYLSSGNVYVTIFIIKIFNILFIILSFFLLYKYFALCFKKELLAPFLVFLLIALNPDIFITTGKISTEIPFLFMTIVSMYCFELYFSELSRIKAGIFLVASIMFWVIASYLRDVGYILILAMVLYAVFSKKSLKAIAFLLILIVPMIFEYSYIKNAIMHYLTSIFSNPQSMISRGLWYARNGIPQIVLPFELARGSAVISYGISLAIVYGFIVKVIKSISVFDIYIVIYILVFLNYLEVSGRWFIPIIPFLLFYFAHGIQSVLADCANLIHRQRIVGRRISFAIITAIIISYGQIDMNYVIDLNSHRLFYPPIARNYAEAGEFIARTSTGNDHVMSAQPGYMALYARVQVDGINQVAPDQLWKIIMDGEYNYLVSSQGNGKSLLKTEHFIRQFIQAYSNRFKEVFNSDDKVRVYKIVKDINLQLTDETNLLQDPEFELKDYQGNYLKWTRWGDGGLEIQSAVDKKGALIFARQDAGHEALRQEVIVDKSKTYALSFNAKTDRPESFRVDFDKKRIVVTEKAEKKYYLTFIPNKDKILIELRQRSPGNTWFYDIRLYEASVQKEYKFEGVFVNQQPYQLEFNAKTNQIGSGRCEIYADDSLIASIKIDSLEWKPYQVKMKKIPYKPTFLFVQREIGCAWINKVKLVNLISGEAVVLYDK